MSGLGNLEQSVVDEGVYWEENSVLGKQVDAQLAHGYYFKTPEGLRFCKSRNFDDERIRNILENLLPGSSLGFYKSYGAAERDLCVLNRTSEETKVIVVQFWSSKSRVVFHRNSHRHVLNAIAAPTGLLEIPAVELNTTEIARQIAPMGGGGFSILDGRTGFRILEGRAIMFAFVAPDELIHWAKMELPNLPELQAEVEEIETNYKTIGVNFKFVERRFGVNCA
ncbi:hypothetical protein QQS21_004971 [Conoideocrella luteorostrata]|uniref:Uncharacterized protein n=1 Tax=Conoideocrella luteorostrata TaxID=1105319 RepID=A0AAJ0FZH9_9HYPO|nr:hypothetical protein QQS21_004971 [Conoideocrella luteorostrata]